MKLVGNWNYPTSVRFGAGRIAELGAAVKAAGIVAAAARHRPAAGRASPGQARARRAGATTASPAAVFCDVKPNPVASNVEAGLAALKAGRHDGVDRDGRRLGARCRQGHRLHGRADATHVGLRGRRRLVDPRGPEGILPIVAVPTTAGTGSEVGRAGVITDETTHTKKVIFHPRMMPAITICDPELTVGMPPAITAGTGMDALAHCLEAYCGPFYHPLADGIAVEGMRLVKENLARAYQQGSDLEARAHMMSAAAMGATAFQKALGAIHALSHPVGALYDTHHGLTNAVFMPYVLAFNRPAIEDKIARLAAYLGLEPTFDAFLAWVLALRAEIGVPAHAGRPEGGRRDSST